MLPIFDAIVDSLLNVCFDRWVMTAVSAAPFMLGGLNTTTESGVASDFPDEGPVRCCNGEFLFSIRDRFNILLIA